VEEALRELPEVEEAVVFGVPDRTWGDRVAAALVLREGAILPAEEIRAHAARRLAPHKRPRLLALLPAAPRAASGKIDRAAAVRAARPRLRPL